MAKFKVQYTLESWREVMVEADNEYEARKKFSDGIVDWSTDYEYDSYLDYDSPSFMEVK